MANLVSPKANLGNRREAADNCFQFLVFADCLSVGHGLNAKNQKAMRFRTGNRANMHPIE